MNACSGKKSAGSCPVGPFASSGGCTAVSEEDIYEAMKYVEGYLDISPDDLRTLFQTAYRMAWDRMGRSLLARDVMVTDVISVHPDMPLGVVASTMARNNVSGVPVVGDDRTVLGMVSERDFLSRMAAGETGGVMGIVAGCLSGAGCGASAVAGKNARDIMNAPAVTVSETAPLGDVAVLFAGRGFNRVPVTDGENRLVGIVSRGDLVRAFGGMCVK